MNLQMIPVDIDYKQILDELNAMGWTDYKICLACGLPLRSARFLREGRIAHMNYQNSARLYNFWLEEQRAAAVNLTQEAATTT